MKFQNSGIEEVKADLHRLDSTLLEHGFVRAGQWDYERATYDRKMEIKNEIFYLRIRGYATEGDIGSRHAVIQLLEPILGKHYYPHGVEYGPDEHFPTYLVEKCEAILKEVKESIETINITEVT